MSSDNSGTPAGHGVLAVNAGSSSLKLRLLGPDNELVESWDALPEVLPDVGLVAHRFVHGGYLFDGPVVIDESVEATLEELSALAPLHQPKSLAALADVRKLLPDAVHVACFDTAFHATIPDAAAIYAVPAEWTTKYALRRYGFHGLSHSWAAGRARELAPEARRVVVCHLGAGASLAAVLDGRSVDTTMGFTPLEGLVMATRSGDVDPGLLLWLAQREPNLAEGLEKRSGLLGLAGTGDMRELLERSDDAAVLALEIYLHRLRKSIASMTVSLGGIDACMFTGGVGENAPAIRQRALDGLAHLGLGVDPQANAGAGDGSEITGAGCPARSFVVAAREELEMARQARTMLGQAR